jgi:Na+/H+ antiporter NhaD/arsenite permease-like protein
MNFWITLVIVAVTYVGVAIGRWPRLRANRATIALMGAGLLIVTRQIQFEQIFNFLDMDTLMLLFSMMIINANLQLAGFFEMAGNTILKVTRTPRGFLALEIILSGFLSALFLNDTICLMFTPLILNITLRLKRNPIPYLIALATAANIGSTATLTGNPQNMIVGMASGIGFIDFAWALTPVALLGMGGIWLVLVLLYRWEFRDQQFEEMGSDTTHSVAEDHQQDSENSEKIDKKWLLIKTLGVTAAMLLAFLLGVPVAEAAFMAACVLLFTRRITPEKVFSEINWGLLVFFSGLFIVTGSLEVNGVTQKLFSLVDITRQANAWSFSAVTVVLSNLVSNVPAVLLLKPLVPLLSNPKAGWLTLAAASTLAGNLTLLGSVANLIVAEIARSFRVEMSFWEYTRAGFVITVLSLVTGTVWLSIFIWN